MSDVKENIYFLNILSYFLITVGYASSHWLLYVGSVLLLISLAAEFVLFLKAPKPLKNAKRMLGYMILNILYIVTLVMKKSFS